MQKYGILNVLFPTDTIKYTTAVIDHDCKVVDIEIETTEGYTDEVYVPLDLFIEWVEDNMPYDSFPMLYGEDHHGRSLVDPIEVWDRWMTIYTRQRFFDENCSMRKLPLAEFVREEEHTQYEHFRGWFIQSRRIGWKDAPAYMLAIYQAVIDDTWPDYTILTGVSEEEQILLNNVCDRISRDILAKAFADA